MYILHLPVGGKRITCKGTEDVMNKMIVACKCKQFYSDDCQLKFGGDPYNLSCKPNTTSECKAMITMWADKYKNAPNADDPKCKLSQGYKLSQNTKNNCL